MASNINDLTGKCIGRLTILKRYRYRPLGWKADQTFYDCVCGCGKLLHRSHSNLISGKKQSKIEKSCGCAQKDWLIHRSLKEPGQHAAHTIWNWYKNNAKTRNIYWELTEEEFRIMIFKNCFYCGLHPFSETTAKGVNVTQIKFTGIDRVNNNKGYEIINCVPCCKWCNFAKNALYIHDFIDHIKRIEEHQNHHKQINLIEIQQNLISEVVMYQFNIYKRNARHRNKNWNLTKDVFQNIILKPCYYCGLSWSMNTKKRWRNERLKHNGIDRLNSDLGYIEGNIVPACKNCNKFKNSRSIENFLIWAKLVYENTNQVFTLPVVS